MKIFLLSLFISLSYGFDKPRGIPFSKLSFYQPNIPFKCLDGSGTISWDKINDDYCDCTDASDEPGTAACSNGLFFCDNKGHRGANIFSSRVNDGICDCCDGSDEYSGLIQCNNSCWEIGEKSRENDKKLRESEERGHAIYLQYIKQHEESASVKKTRLDTIKTELDFLSEDKLEVEKRRDAAENLEKEAKKVVDDRRAALQEANELSEQKHTIAEAFSSLDANDDGRVGIDEMQTHDEFDTDQNGEVSHEEIKEFFNELESVDETYFTDSVWPNIKQLYKSKPNTETTVHDDDSSLPIAPDTKLPIEEHTGNESTPVDKPESEYDEATLGLIAAADIARRNYDELNAKYTKLEEEKRSIEELLSIDYGPNSSFYALADSETCYELTDHEYTYKLCPFKKTSQMSKSAGSETVLGKWGRWTGTSNPYGSQIYEDGEGCWNGPRRSTKIDIRCGMENKLVSVLEPSRCEYSFEFETPAACNQLSEEFSHEEL